MDRTYLAAGVLTLAISLGAFAATRDAPAEARFDPAGGTCLEGTVDCDDTPGQDPAPEDVYDDEAAVERAQGLLGRTEAELEGDVRIGRRGEEHMMLTEDYQLGRMTVALDRNDADEWVVTAVTVELTDGPQTFTS